MSCNLSAAMAEHPKMFSQQVAREKFSVMIKEENVNGDCRNEDQILRKERYPKIDIAINEHAQISLRDIVEALKNLGYSFDNKTISYFDAKKKLFIFCRKEENLLEYKINIEEIPEKEIFLKCRQLSKSLIEEILNKNDQSDEGEESKHLNKNKRTKERTISEVVQKVALWRKLYNGFYDHNSNQVITKTLEDGAKQIGISKKTLDDYLSQIRLGKKYGFNFNENKDNKIGTLRAFVKKNRQKKNSYKNEDDDV